MDDWIYKNRSVAFLTWYVEAPPRIVPTVSEYFREDLKDHDYSISVVKSVANHEGYSSKQLRDMSSNFEFIKPEARQTDITLWDAFEVDLPVALSTAISCNIVVLLVAPINLDELGNSIRILKEEGCQVVILAVDENPERERAKRELAQLVDAVCNKLESELRDRDIKHDSSIIA